MRYGNGAPAAMRARVLRSPIALAASVVIGASLFGAGCSSGNGSSSSSTLVKSINAYVPGPGVDATVTLFANTIYLTGGNTTSFGQVANGGGYITINSGTYNLAASGPALTPAVTLNNYVFMGSNAAYTVVAAGEAGQAAGTLKAPQIIVMPNYVKNQLALPSGTSAIRVLNASFNPNNVGLFATASGTPSATLAPATASLAFGYGAGTNVYEAIPTSSLTNMALIDVTAPTKSLGVSGTSNLNSQSFVAGNAYTLIIYGQPGNSSQPFGCTWVQDYPAP